MTYKAILFMPVLLAVLTLMMTSIGSAQGFGFGIMSQNQTGVEGTNWMA